MEIGFIGLGRMGANMVRRLLRENHRVVAWNRTAAKTQEIVSEGAEGAYSLRELVEKLQTPRIVWTMVPAGQATDDMINEVTPLLSKGDIIIDGGNSNYKDSNSTRQRTRRQRFPIYGCRYEWWHLGPASWLLFDGWK